MKRLVLVHGFTGSGESWDPVRAHLKAPGTHVQVVTLPGHAGRPPVGTWAEAARALADAIDGEGGGPVHLAGYSMGARLALGLLLERPQLVERATLIGVNPGLPEGPERWARRQWDGRWIQLLRREGLEAFLEQWEALPLFETQRDADPKVLEAQRRIRRSHEPEGLARAMEAMGLSAMPDFSPRLTEVDRPVLLVVGERDPRFRRLAEWMARRLPEGRIEVLPGVGHNPLVEAPDRLAGLLAPGVLEEDAA